MLKIYYRVTMNYCCGRLATRSSFKKFTDAQELALKALEDLDNTNITIEEIEVKGFFKKTYTSKIIAIYNEN